MKSLPIVQPSPDMVEQVHRSLLDAISDGSLAPGQRVRQEELAAQLATSRQPVLQALRLLKKDGFLVDSRPQGKTDGARGQGLTVAPLHADWIAQVYQVRGALDVLAVRLACHNNVPSNPMAFGQHAVAKIIEAGRQAVEQRNVRAMMDADCAFHDAIYAASGNALIAQSAQLHWAHIRRAMGAVLQFSGIRSAVWDEHAAIAQAINHSDSKRAEHLMGAHCEGASRNMLIHLSRNLLSPTPANANPSTTRKRHATHATAN